LWKSPTDGHDEAAAAPKNGDSSGVPIPLTDTTEALPPTSSSSSSPAATATGTLQPQSQPQTQTQTQTQSTMTTTKRPGRRKPKTQLAEVPAASDSHKGKGKKLTTLEKSALDWNAHVHSSGAVELASELEANRRGGGYLEKVEFLQRVGDRKNEALEANSDHKRRRG
jgi:Bucentaur or craniofacial development